MLQMKPLEGCLAQVFFFFIEFINLYFGDFLGDFCDFHYGQFDINQVSLWYNLYQLH